MTKRIIGFVMLTVMLLQITACSGSISEEDIVGNTYAFLTQHSEEAFIISIFESGIFTYSEGVGSDYIGAGEWSLEGNTLKLVDQKSPERLTNYFSVQKDKIVFIEADSDNFPNVQLTSKCEFYKLIINEHE